MLSAHSAHSAAALPASSIRSLFPSTRELLTPAFYQGYDPLPRGAAYAVLSRALRTCMRAVGFRVVVEGAEHLPARPALLCTNSTQRYDFFALMRALELQPPSTRRMVATVTKAKNYHAPGLGYVMARGGVVPLASRGYLIVRDFVELFGRRPTDVEYRAVRAHLDANAPLPAPLTPLTTTARDVVGVAFDPRGTTYAAHVQRVYALGLEQTVRLARGAVDAGMHVQIYPEGTVSRRLGVGRIGAVQLALALGLDVVPVAMSGCPDAFLRATPIPRRATVTVRVGAPLDLAPFHIPHSHRPFHPDDERRNRGALQAATDALMGRLDEQLDEPWRRADAPVAGKGVRAFL